ncbi:MAG: methyltransferase domain-containing protein, partial [Candidatus Andersenbacteria bacterium]
MARHYTYKSFPFSSHTVIAKMLREAKAESILDVGCAEGFLAKALTYRPSILIGIDNNIDHKPQGYTHFIKADLEESNFNFNTRFDAIVFADVLEHLVKPQVVLQKIKRYVSEDGFILVSVPNMDFLLARLPRFLGITLEMNRGLFDKTHKQEFNLKKIEDFLKVNEFEIIEREFTPVPLPLIFTAFDKGRFLYPIYLLLAFVTQSFPSIFAYQVIVK